MKAPMWLLKAPVSTAFLLGTAALAVLTTLLLAPLAIQ
jgi:hypothetical protein